MNVQTMRFTQIVFVLSFIFTGSSAVANCFDVADDNRTKANAYIEKLRNYYNNIADNDCLVSLPIYEQLTSNQEDFKALPVDAQAERLVPKNLTEVRSTLQKYAQIYEQFVDASDSPTYAAIRRASEDIDRLFDAPSWQDGLARDVYGSFLTEYPADSACGDRCRDRYESSVYSLAFIGFMSKVAATSNAQSAEAYVKNHENRYKRWNAYLDVEQFQYPWELSANFCLHESSLKGFRKVQCLIPVLGGIKTRKLLDNASRVGFKEAPSWRAIFLHPEVGISLGNNQADGDEIEPSLIVEWIGLSWWRWNNLDGGGFDSDKPFKCPLSLCPVGASLSTAFVDLPDNEDIGHGVSLRFRNFTVTTTWHEGEGGNGTEPVYSLSLNLSKLFTDAGGDSKKFLRSLLNPE